MASLITVLLPCFCWPSVVRADQLAGVGHNAQDNSTFMHAEILLLLCTDQLAWLQATADFVQRQRLLAKLATAICCCHKVTNIMT